MKFNSTTYTNKTEILKFTDHYVSIPVMVDDAGIVANAEGKKLILAGTIVGGGTLSDETVKVKKNVSAALVTTLVGNNNDFVFTAKTDRVIKITLLDPVGNSKALAVSVNAVGIVVSLATSGAGAIISTAAEIKAAIEADYNANELVTVTYPALNDGTGVVTALVATTLTGGVSAEGVLLNDVDLTYGSAPGSMVIHGFIDLNKLPEAPTANAIATLKTRITFLK